MAGGKYIEIAGDSLSEIAENNYDIYAGRHIINTAAKSVIETGTNKGVIFGEAQHPPLKEIKSKVLVNFRPYNSWTGQFGFDWMRVGDTSLLGDNWYRDIIGKNRNAAGTLLDIYDGGILKTDIKEYTRLMHQFKVMKINWKNDFYIIPWLSLYSNQIATLSLKLEIEQVPKKLEFQFDESLFELNHKEITHKTKGKITLPDYLTIKCIKTFNNDQFIKVFADNELAGAIQIHRNGKVNRRKVNIVLARVKTNVGGTRAGERGNIVGEQAKLQKHLKQALITPNVVFDDMVDVSRDTFFNRRFINAAKQIVYSGNQLHDYMLHTYDLRVKYPNHFIVYVFELPNPTAGGQAYGIPSDNALVFSSTTRRKTALVHELLHGLGLQHSFGNDSNFTLSKGKTDNIMDYLDTRRTIWKWQWDIIRKNILVKPE